MPCLALCSSKWNSRTGINERGISLRSARFLPPFSLQVFPTSSIGSLFLKTHVSSRTVERTSATVSMSSGIIIQPSRPPTFVEELSGGDASDELHSTLRAYSWKSLPERQSTWLNVSSGSGEFMVLRANIFGSGLHRREEQSSPGMLINSDWGT